MMVDALRGQHFQVFGGFRPDSILPKFEVLASQENMQGYTGHISAGGSEWIVEKRASDDLKVCLKGIVTEQYTFQHVLGSSSDSTPYCEGVLQSFQTASTPSPLRKASGRRW
jgi:hypothetical protein